LDVILLFFEPCNFRFVSEVTPTEIFLLSKISSNSSSLSAVSCSSIPYHFSFSGCPQLVRPIILPTRIGSNYISFQLVAGQEEVSPMAIMLFHRLWTAWILHFFSNGVNSYTTVIRLMTK